jgi:HEPN domain-containing protein
MSAERLIANYLRIDNEHLAGAELLSRAGNRNAAYLCEQAAEKLLRAVVTSEGIHGGNSHRLGVMLNDVPRENPLWYDSAELIELES